MGVPCPGCGRSYEVALFQFGRTIDCRCGGRVGLEPRVRELAPGWRPRFLLDAMLGRLARWLRILGYDAAWEEHISDEALVRRGLEEERIILTRDRRLQTQWSVSGIRQVQAEAPMAQLAEVVAAFDLLPGARPLSRCSRCNSELQEASAREARGRVPEAILRRFDRFRRCPSCARIYWEGSHAARIRGVLTRCAGDAAPGAGEDPR